MKLNPDQLMARENIIKYKIYLKLLLFWVDRQKVDIPDIKKSLKPSPPGRSGTPGTPGTR